MRRGLAAGDSARRCGAPWFGPAAAALLILLTVPPVAAAPAPTDLGTLNAPPDSQYPVPPESQANAINASGEVVGQALKVSSYAGAGHPFATVWMPPATVGGSYAPALSIGTDGTEANSVNSAGLIVGDDGRLPIVWTQVAGGGYTQTSIDMLGIGGRANAVNDAGEIAGTTITNSSALIWVPADPPGTYVESVLPGGAVGGSAANAINQAGEIVGYFFSPNGAQHAAVWRRATPAGPFSVVDLGAFPGGYSQALGINDAGQVVGFAAGAPDFARHGVVWNPLPGGGYADPIDILPPPDSTGDAIASAIDSSGRIAGYTNARTAVLLIPSGGDGGYTVSQLGSLSSQNFYATAMNDAGQVAGSSSTAAQRPRAAVWSPHLVLSGLPSGVAAGTPATVTVSAEDAAGNPAPWYAGRVRLTSSDAAAVLPPETTLWGGQRTLSVTFNTAGSQSLTATDVDRPAISDTQSKIAVSAAAQLAVAKAGTGSGTVTSSPGGLNCGLSCSARLPPGVSVTLTAAAAPGSSFTGWSGGGCTGTGACTLALLGDTTVTATFSGSEHSLGVAMAGLGAGSVSSSPSGISCAPTCQQLVSSGTQVALRAQPAPGSRFAGWSGGGCSGTTTSCTLSVNADVNVTATFQQPVVTFSRSALDFGGRRVGTTSDPQAVAVINGGDAPLLVSGATATPSDYTASSGCGSVLAPGDACPLTVRFTPARAGPRPGGVAVTDDAVNSPQTLSLAGTGMTSFTAEASAAYLEGVTLLGGTSAALHVPDGGLGVCDTGPLSNTGSSRTSASGQACPAISSLVSSVISGGAVETAETRTANCAAACARSTAAWATVLPGMGPGGSDLVHAEGLDARSSASCVAAPSSATSVVRLSIAGQTVATRPVGGRLIVDPTGGGRGVTVQGSPLAVNATGARIPMAVVTLNYSRQAIDGPGRGRSESSSPVVIDFPAHGPLSSLIVGRVHLSYARSGVHGC